MQNSDFINWDKVPEQFNSINVQLCNGYSSSALNTYYRPVDLMCYTSLMHYDNMNIQSDFHGIKDTVIKMFRQECFHRGVIWAKLFDKNGCMIDTYDKRDNLIKDVRLC